MCSNPGTQPLAIITMKYTWEVDREVRLDKHPGDCIKSPTFCDNKYKDVKWQLLLYPNGSNHEVEGMVSLFAMCKSPSAYNLFALVPPKIECVIDSYFNDRKTFNSCNQLCVSRDKNANCWGFPKFMTSSKLLHFASEAYFDYNDKYFGFGMMAPKFVKFRVKCNINHVLSLASTDIECPLHDDIGQLLETRKLSDVKLKVNEEIFHAHKLILAARSPVFAAMFEHEMSENAGGFVDIVDADNEVFKEMLTYIYTEQAPNLKDMAFGLLPIADKYQLDKLRDMCSVYLGNNLTAENVSDVLILADLCQCTKLKAKAIAFINTHGKSVIATEGYKSLTKLHQHLIVECHQALW